MRTPCPYTNAHGYERQPITYSGQHARTIYGAIQRELARGERIIARIPTFHRVGVHYQPNPHVIVKPTRRIL